MIEINNKEEMKKYYNEKTDTYVFKDDVKFNCYIDCSEKIKAFDIKADFIKANYIYAHDIDAHYIEAEGIRAHDIDAYNIKVIFMLYAHNIKTNGAIDTYHLEANNIEAYEIHVNDIDARNIEAFDIIACDIEAIDIIVDNIKAKNIDAENIEDIKNKKEVVKTTLINKNGEGLETILIYNKENKNETQTTNKDV